MSAFGGKILTMVQKNSPNCLMSVSSEWNLSELSGLLAGEIDIHIGALRTFDREIRWRCLFATEVIGLVRKDHPLVGQKLTPQNLIPYRFLGISRLRRGEKRVDVLLGHLGMSGGVATIAQTYAQALNILKNSDLVLFVPGFIRSFRYMIPPGFVPLAVPEKWNKIEYFLAWHRQTEASPAKARLRKDIGSLISYLAYQLPPNECSEGLHKEKSPPAFLPSNTGLTSIKI